MQSSVVVHRAPVGMGAHVVAVAPCIADVQVNPNPQA
jgi:hypothetical protein